MKQKIIQNIKVIVICLIIAAGVSYASAWTNAPLNPPNNNVDAPLNAGSLQQDKLGALRINTSTSSPAATGLFVWGNSIFNGGMKINTGSAVSGQVLTSTDASGTVAWQSISSIPSNMIVFDTPGTTNWTAPAGATRVRVKAWGGGGGSGTYYHSGFNNITTCGGGGGGGGYAESIVPVTPGVSYTVTVGAGGAAGSAQTLYSNGTNGGSSSFSNLVLAGGGAGGVSTINSAITSLNNAGAGGTASGTIALYGQMGTGVSSCGITANQNGNIIPGGVSPYGGSGWNSQSLTDGYLNNIPGGGGWSDIYVGTSHSALDPLTSGAHGRVILEY